MKNLIIVLISILLFSFGCKTNKPVADSQAVPEQSSETKVINKWADQTTWILGYFERNRLATPPHSEWYLNGYDDYVFKSDIVNKLTDISKEGLSITLVMGSWCPDSRREVPRFMKIIDVWQFPVDKITFIGVDNSKQSPIGGFDKLEIERVPTFILYRNNIEAGRIIENPLTSLEQDMVNILTKE